MHFTRNVALQSPRLVIDRIRRNTTPPVIAEIILTLISAILWLALGLRINSTKINMFSCSIFKEAPGQSQTRDQAKHPAHSRILGYDILKKDFSYDLVSVCRQLKVFEVLGFAAFGIRTSTPDRYNSLSLTWNTSYTLLHIPNCDGFLAPQ
jgi:hypothetical protein